MCAVRVCPRVMRTGVRGSPPLCSSRHRTTLGCSRQPALTRRQRVRSSRGCSTWRSHFLLSAAARSLSAAKIVRIPDRGVENVSLRLRWPKTDGKPECPDCGCVLCYECRRSAAHSRWRRQSARLACCSGRSGGTGADAATAGGAEIHATVGRSITAKARRQDRDDLFREGTNGMAGTHQSKSRSRIERLETITSSGACPSECTARRRQERQ
jgi:hypothetical protein